LNVDDATAYRACALAIRDELIRRWNVTTSYHTKQAPKRAYYFSLEYLMVSSSVLSLYHTVAYRLALTTVGKDARQCCPQLGYEGHGCGNHGQARFQL
jgi:starch phosphorylase